MSRTLIFLMALCLAACSAQSTLATLPGDVRAQAVANVDRIMAGDMAVVREAFPDASGEAFEAAIARMDVEARRGEERARNLVAAETNRADFRLAYEVETPAGFTVISQTFAPATSEARLAAIDVVGSDTSLAAQKRRLNTAARLIGGAFLLGLIGIGLALLRNRPHNRKTS